jgi:trimeric autotransporter adhesin
MRAGGSRTGKASRVMRAAGLGLPVPFQLLGGRPGGAGAHSRAAGKPSARAPLVGTALVLILAAAGCTYSVTLPTPRLSSISPSSIQANSPSTTLTAKGGNFIAGSAILLNRVLLSTTFVSGSELQAQIPPQALQAPGTLTVVVQNGAGVGGPVSNILDLTITPAPTGIPTIRSVSPQSSIAGSVQFTLTVNGTNFAANSVVTWNGANLTTALSSQSNTQLFATVPSSDVAVAGTIQVAVLNAAPGGGLSNPVSFAVVNGFPEITSLSPFTAQAGGATFTLTVNGGGFACAVETTTTTNGTTTTTCTTSASVINFNGSPQTTTFISGTQVSASIDASLIALAGPVQVTVTNPPPGGGTSAPVAFNVIPTSSGGGLPELVDVSSSGTQASQGIGNPGQSGPVVAGGGRFVVFSSVSQNLAANLTNNVANVFERDSCLGQAATCAPTTTLVSLSSNGAVPNADSLEPSVSSDARYVVFASAATTLVSPNLPSGTPAQIYLRDTCTGAASICKPATTLVSVATDGTSPGNDASTEPSLSSDGQFVIFASSATNLVSLPSGVSIPSRAQEIYVRTTCAGATSPCTPATTLVSLQPDNVTPADGASGQPVVKPGGRFVAFSSTATTLVGVASGGIEQVYWRDTCTGVSSGCTPATALVSVTADGTAAGNAASSAPSLGSDGRFVDFASAATNLVTPNLPGGTPAQIYQRDTCTGASGCTPATALVSVATDGASPANAPAVEPAADSTGRFVAFSTAAGNFASANGQAQIYVRDTCAEASGCTPKTVFVSQSASGVAGNAASTSPALDAAGKFAAFVSLADNLVTNDATPTLDDIFLAVTTF